MNADESKKKKRGHAIALFSGGLDSALAILLMLKQDIERLLMITEALWNLMKEQHGYAKEDLVRRIEDIDLKDGVLDGRVATPSVEKCPHCERPNSKKRSLCLYCGEPLSTDPFAR